MAAGEISFTVVDTIVAVPVWVDATEGPDRGALTTEEVGDGAGVALFVDDAAPATSTTENPELDSPFKDAVFVLSIVAGFVTVVIVVVATDVEPGVDVAGPPSTWTTENVGRSRARSPSARPLPASCSKGLPLACKITRDSKESGSKGSNMAKQETKWKKIDRRTLLSPTGSNWQLTAIENKEPLKTVRDSKKGFLFLRLVESMAYLEYAS